MARKPSGWHHRRFSSSNLRKMNTQYHGSKSPRYVLRRSTSPMKYKRYLSGKKPFDTTSLLNKNRLKPLTAGGGANYISHRFGRVTRFTIPAKTLGKGKRTKSLMHVPMARTTSRRSYRNYAIAGGVAAAGAGAYAYHRRRRARRDYKGRFAGSY